MAAEDVLSETMAAIFTNLSALFEAIRTRNFWRGVTGLRGTRRTTTIARKPLTAWTRSRWRNCGIWSKTIGNTPRIGNCIRPIFMRPLVHLDKSKPECREYLWNRFVLGFDYVEMAEELNLKYDAIRRRVERCLEEVRGLIRTKTPMKRR